jgi:putative hemolysin
VSNVPDFVFQWPGDAAQLRVFFEGDGDATLLVVGAADTTVSCADETDANNRNPLVILDDPAAGLYGVWVGRLDPSQPISGVLTITTDPDATPAVLEPTQSPVGGVGVANPASVFCVNQGGKVDIRSAADGSQSGFCVFPGGGECDEWAYYRGECKPGQSN